jgi:hypothetical protein
MKDASALLVVLSKASVESEWCKKELSYGLTRELEERRVVIIPILIEDCDIPPFLKDKLYADFRSDFDAGLADVLKGVAKHTSDTLGRTNPKDAEYFHDWGVSWGEHEGHVVLEIVAVTHSKKFPYTVLTTIRAHGNDEATRRYQHFAREGYDWFARKTVIAMMHEFSDPDMWRLVIDDSLPVTRDFGMKDSKSSLMYNINMSVRRLGEDTGMGILFDVKPIVDAVFQQIESARRPLPNSEVQRLMRLIQTT